METFDPMQVRAFVASQVLGLCAGWEEGVLTGKQAANWLFRNDMLKRLEDAGACKGCLGVVDRGARLAEEGATEDDIRALRARALAILKVVAQA